MTSASVWNSKTPKADRVSLYYSDWFDLEAVNDETKSIGSVLRAFPGKGKNNDKSKLAMQIPPGQTTLRFNYKMGFSSTTSEVSYDFQPGSHYRLTGILKEGFNMADFAKTTVGAGENPWDWKVEKIK
jgi:hypothetical protein